MSHRLHMVGLPHTQTIVETMTVCAFTMKLVKFCEMMGPLGYDIYLYSGEHNEAPVAEHIPVFTDAQQREWYGDHDPNLLPTIATWNSADTQWMQMNHRAIAEISGRIEPGDLILLLAGLAQKPIADAFPNHRSLEWAAGYDGIFAPYVCFESYAWMHYLYGRKFSDNAGGNGRWYDTVIPNYFRPEDFEPVSDPSRDYLLFVGRMTAKKGPHIAAEIAQAAGMRIIFAGSGVAFANQGLIVANEGFRLEGDVEYVGVADVRTRNELMANARALIAPTTYVEPFGAVAVEAQLCGTPAITTDWGAFPETVEHGFTGFHFRTLAEAAEAVERCEGLSSDYIRERALDTYSLKAIAPRYDRWLQNVAELDGKGWYAGTSLGQITPESAQIEAQNGQIVDGSAPDYVVPEEAPHLGGYIAGGDPATYCPDLWRWLIEEWGVQTVLDVGCGEGHAVQFFRQMGCEVLGIDGVQQDDPDILTWDFTEGPLPLPLNKNHEIDLIWSCEFVEHVEEQYVDNFLPLFSRGKLVLITHADPGQPGHHHVNCQSDTYWIRRVARHGLLFSQGITQQTRLLAPPDSHFARSGLAFRPVGAAYSGGR